MGRAIFQLAVGGLALLLFSRDQPAWAVFCLTVMVLSLSGPWLGMMTGRLRRLTSIPEEHDANSVLTYSFRLDRVFEHPAVDALFAKLLRNQKAPTQTREEWRKPLADGYARKYRRDDSICEVRFNIKSNLLFVDGEPSFGDHVYHDLDIPYRWTDAGEPQEPQDLTPEIEAQLSVRVLLLNGMLLLQVGRFSKEYSPKILSGVSLATYETFATITSFPLMYFSVQHGIPVRYLNLIPEATPAYKASRTEPSRGMTKKPDRYRDWRTLQQEVAGYRALCGWDDENDSYKVWNKFGKVFEAKREKLLAGEGIRDVQGL